MQQASTVGSPMDTQRLGPFFQRVRGRAGQDGRAVYGQSEAGWGAVLGKARMALACCVGDEARSFAAQPQ